MRKPLNLPALLETTALPDTSDGWAFYRTSKTKPTLLNEVDRILMEKVDDPEWRKWMDAIWDDDAIEGTVDLDIAELAQLVRDEGKKQNNALVKAANKKQLKTALKRVENRFPELSRRGRREKVLLQLTQQQADATLAEGDE